MSSVRTPSALLAAGILLAIAVSASAARRTFDWGLSVEEKLSGDSNILRLASPEVDRLDRDQAFQPTLDGAGDLRMDHRVLADLRANLPDRRWGWLELGLDAKYVNFFANSFNNYSTQRLSLTWQQKPGWGADVSWFGINNFYLREFQDADTGELHGTDFDSNEYRIRLKARSEDFGPVQKPTLSLIYSFEQVFYNGWFTEYDTDTREVGLRLDVDLPRGLSADLQYYYATTDNVGYDSGRSGGASLIEDNDSGDGSHQENRFQTGVDWRGDLYGHDLQVGLAFSWRHREYQTQLGVLEDPVHAGRNDDRLLLSLNKIWRIEKRYSLRPFIEREWRRVGGPWERLPQYKNYAANRMGIALRVVVR